MAMAGIGNRRQKGRKAAKLQDTFHKHLSVQHAALSMSLSGYSRANTTARRARVPSLKRARKKARLSGGTAVAEESEDEDAAGRSEEEDNAIVEELVRVPLVSKSPNIKPTFASSTPAKRPGSSAKQPQSPTKPRKKKTSTRTTTPTSTTTTSAADSASTPITSVTAPVQPARSLFDVLSKENVADPQPAPKKTKITQPDHADRTLQEAYGMTKVSDRKPAPKPKKKSTKLPFTKDEMQRARDVLVSGAPLRTKLQDLKRLEGLSSQQERRQSLLEAVVFSRQYKTSMYLRDILATLL